MNDTPRPMRATDDERRRAADELAAALGRGQIDLTEFDERTNRVWAARTHDDLVDPLADLVPDPMAAIRGQAARGGDIAPVRDDARPPASSRDLSAVAKAHVTGETGGTPLSVAVMFGSELDGDWVCPPVHTSIAVMGGTDIDLRRARFTAHETRIAAFAVMGGIDVYVPEDVRVSIEGFGLMGGFDKKRSHGTTIAGHDLPPDAPLVRITGLALMGGVDVHVVPRNSSGRADD